MKPEPETIILEFAFPFLQLREIVHFFSSHLTAPWQLCLGCSSSWTGEEITTDKAIAAPPSLLKPNVVHWHAWRTMVLLRYGLSHKLCSGNTFPYGHVRTKKKPQKNNNLITYLFINCIRSFHFLVPIDYIQQKSVYNY